MGYPAHNYMTPEQIEAQRQAMERAKKESHDEGLKGHEREISDYKKANEQFPLQTNFTAHDIDTLKGMIEHANPDGVDTVGKNWKKVHDRLVGAGGGSPSGDSAYGQLKKAVDDVLEHWEGESANQFKVKAEKILKQIANSASHAQNVSEVMTQAANDLRTQRDAISKIEKPNWLESAWDRITDSGRDDKYTQQDIKSGNVPKDLIAEANEGYIGEEKEAQLNAAHIMENLGRSYVGYSRRLQSRNPRDESEAIPPSDPASPMPTPIPATSGSTATPSASASPTSKTGLAGASGPQATTGPRDPGISGGQQVPASQTKVDSLPSGISGGVASSAPGGVSGTGASSSTGPVGGTGATAGVPGGGVIGGGAAGSGAARGTAGRAGIGGAGAMGGRGGTGGAGAGGRGTAGASGRGALAKAKGGVAGAPRGISGGRPATPGGTGLGRGRAGVSGTAGRTGAGMLGGARGTSQRSGEEERDQSNRPDYLVEDEETWTPEDNRSVPKTIE